MSRDVVSNLSWLTDAADELAGNEAFELAFTSAIHRWLNKYSLAAERMVMLPDNEEYAAQRETQLADRERKLSATMASLSLVEQNRLAGMVREDHGDYSQLSRLAFRALAGRSLAPFAESLRN